MTPIRCEYCGSRALTPREDALFCKDCGNLTPLHDPKPSFRMPCVELSRASVLYIGTAAVQAGAMRELLALLSGGKALEAIELVCRLTAMSVSDAKAWLERAHALDLTAPQEHSKFKKV